MRGLKTFFSKSIAIICSLFLFTSLSHAEVDSKASQDNGFQPITVVVVRHAEKAAAPLKNPRLTPEGEARAETLSQMFRETNIDYIYTTQYERTRGTVAPLAKRFNIAIQVVRAAKTDELVGRIMAYPGTFNVVCGHSNTVNLVVEALGGGKMKELADDEYDSMFIVTVYAPGKAKVVKLKY